MDRIALLAVTLHGRRELAERPQTVNLRFEPVGHHRVETVGVGIEHHDRHRDAAFAQQHPLVGECHGQIIHALMLQQLRHLEIARAIAAGLDHGHELHALPQPRPEIIQIVNHSIQIDLQHRRMAFTRKRMFQSLEAAVAIAFQQHGAPRDVGAVDAPQIVVGRGIKGLLAGEQRRVGLQFRPDADNSLHAGRRDHRRHARVEVAVVHTALKDIRKNQRRGTSRRHAVQVIEGDAQ